MTGGDSLGTDRLDDRTALVAGGTGNVGRVVVHRLLERGATVAVPSRSRDKLERLRREVGAEQEARLVGLEGDMGDEDDASRIRDELVARVGPLDAVVATLGRFVAAPSVLAAPLDDLKATLDGYLLAHFVVARTLIPALRDGGSYTFINGPLAYRPVSGGAGLVSIVTAAQAMFARITMAETKESPVRVNEVVVYTAFGWGDDRARQGAVGQEDVGRYIALLASPRGSAVRGETVHLDSLQPLEALTAA